MPKLLIADDNKQITDILSEYARREGFETHVATDGAAAYELFYEHDFDCLLLDVMMPHIDGFSLCKQIRQTSNVPIILITARKEDYEKIMGLEIGADDYVVKPFSPGEVMARVKALLRRVSSDSSLRSVSVGNLTVDLDNYRATINGEEVLLTKKEFEILWTLVSAKGRVFSREALLDAVWGFEYYGDGRSVDSHIKRLRAKLAAFDHPSWEIKTIWGVGYRFEVNDDVSG